MDPATYIAASGLKANLRALDIASNNMANVDSPGFKADEPFYRMLQKSYGDLSGSAVAGTMTDFTTGTFKQTGNPLDVAINGEGFLTVRTPQGIGYTRNGSLTISTAGELVTQDGYQVLDNFDQPIPVAIDPSRANEVIINKNGEITIDEQRIGTLKVVDFEDKSQLTKLKDQIFVTDQQPTQVVAPMVEQGVVEQSNANAIKTMIDMVELQRMYDMNSKIVQNVMNQINRRAIADIAGNNS